MLGKLIKYDLKAGSHIITSTYIFIILCAVFSRIMAAISDTASGNWAYAARFLFMVSSFILILSVIATCAITLVWVVLRYRNNLLRDEGYLMHTLPVSPVSLYFSKIITAMVFFLADIAVILFSFIISGMPKAYNITWDNFKIAFTTFHYGAQEYGVNGNLYIGCVIVLFIVALYTSIAQFFASLNIGYSLPFGKGSSRDLISVAAYIITYIVTQVLTIVLFIVAALLSGFRLTDETAILEYTAAMLFLAIAVMAVLAVIYNVISIKLMQKKLNLE